MAKPEARHQTRKNFRVAAKQCSHPEPEGPKDATRHLTHNPSATQIHCVKVDTSYLTVPKSSGTMNHMDGKTEKPYPSLAERDHKATKL